MQPSTTHRTAATHAYESRFHVDGIGPPLIFVPGMDGTGRLFHRQRPGLARRFRVATYGLRDDATCMETLVDDLHERIGDLAPGGEPVVIVGESFGGALALSFALRHPQRVRGLVVVNSFPHFTSQLRLRLGLAGLRVMPWRAMVLLRGLSVAHMHSRSTPRSEIRHFLEQTKDTTRRGYVGRLRILREYDVRDRLAEIRVPTLFVAAERDRLLPAVAYAQYMAERVPGSSLRILGGQGHACLIAPDVDLARLLNEWLCQGNPDIISGTP